MAVGVKGVQCMYVTYDKTANTITRNGVRMTTDPDLDFQAGACPPTYESAVADGISWMDDNGGSYTRAGSEWACVANCQETWNCSR